MPPLVICLRYLFYYLAGFVAYRYRKPLHLFYYLPGLAAALTMGRLLTQHLESLLNQRVFILQLVFGKHVDGNVRSNPVFNRLHVLIVVRAGGETDAPSVGQFGRERESRSATGPVA